MKIVWSRLAVLDLAAIRSYIAVHNPVAAADIAARIVASTDLLTDQPQLGLPTHRADVRRLVVAGTVYSIPYRIRSGRIEILEVFDGRRGRSRTNLRSR